MSRGRLTVVPISYTFCACVFIVARLGHAADGVHLYANSEYGFSVKIPSGRPTCRAEQGMPDTGILIFLDQGHSGCENRDERPYVSVNGTYNAENSSSAREALSIVCGDAKPEPTDPNLFGNLKEKWTVMCRFEVSNGFIEYVLVRQSSPKAVNGASLVNYSIAVHLPANDADMKVKDAIPILRSVHFFKPSG